MRSRPSGSLDCPGDHKTAVFIIHARHFRVHGHGGLIIAATMDVDVFRWKVNVDGLLGVQQHQ